MDMNKLTLLILVIIPILFSSKTNFGQQQYCLQCDDNLASGINSSAIGFGSKASGDYSFASGYESNSSGDYSFSSGFRSVSAGNSSFAAGNGANASGHHSIALGPNSYSSPLSFSFGSNAIALGQPSVAIGHYVKATASNSMAIGSVASFDQLINNTPSSLIIGFNSPNPILYVGNPEGSEYGKVGIGTTNPLASLHVEGGIICKSFAMPTENMQKGYVLTCTSLGTADWAPGAESLWSLNNRNIYRESGFVGIGTTIPTSRLQLGNLWTFNDLDDGTKTIGYNTSFVYEDYHYMSSAPASMISFDKNGGISLRVAPSGQVGNPVDSFRNGLYLSNSGNIGVGTENPNAKLHVSGKVFIGENNIAMDQYGLYVEEGIYARVIKVEHPPQWSDFVFSEDYQLISLAELENFINQNGHLPDIPNEDEIKENGIDLGSMDAKLLQKVEELTLYVIELKKDNDQLREKIENLESFKNETVNN